MCPECFQSVELIAGLLMSGSGIGMLVAKLMRRKKDAAETAHCATNVRVRYDNR